MTTPPLTQDVHIHTIFSTGDRSVVEAQTAELVAQVKHADVIGISDHFEHIVEQLDEYRKSLAPHGFSVGTEVSAGHWAAEAAACDFDYYIQHTHDRQEDYDGLETLLATGNPVIIAHPMEMGTDLTRVPRECYVEINNRYVWRRDWRAFYTPFSNSFRFVFSSDAHQPHWLSQHIARFVGQQLDITETLLFNHSQAGLS
ncbi:MAG: hypothetical protein GY801_42135 [bacterium]|nr:hypothetical protein [bacterium]